MSPIKTGYARLPGTSVQRIPPPLGRTYPTGMGAYSLPLLQPPGTAIPGAPAWSDGLLRVRQSRPASASAFVLAAAKALPKAVEGS